MRAIELAGSRAFAAAGPDVIAFGIVLIDVAGAVTVTQVDVAVGSDGEIGGAVLDFRAVRLRAVRLGHGRVAEHEDFFAAESGFDNDAAFGVAEIQKFLTAFAMDQQAMGAAFERAAPGFDEAAVGVENHHGVRRLAGGVDGVVNVDVALSILADTVGVSILDAGGEFTPIVGDLISMVAGAEDGLGGAGFVVRAEDQWGRQTGEESSALHLGKGYHRDQ